jgi:hypothetical protein
MKVSDLIVLYSLSCFRSVFVWWNVFLLLRRRINFTWYLFSSLNILWFVLHLFKRSVICFRLFPAKTVRILYTILFRCLWGLKNFFKVIHFRNHILLYYYYYYYSFNTFPDVFPIYQLRVFWLCNVYFIITL